VVGELVDKLDAPSHALAFEIASTPDRIRRYGPVKEANLQKAKTREAELFATFRVPATASVQAAGTPSAASSALSPISGGPRIRPNSRLEATSRVS